MALLFEDAAKAKNAIMASQQKEIQKLYEDWADDVADRAKFYSTKTNASAAVSERYYKELYKQMKEQSNLIGKEIQGLITSNIYTIADSVVASNVNWLKEFGFSEDGLNASFSYIPNDVVQRLVTGQIYQGGWNLSQRIWSDSQQTQKDVYQVMARGLAEQKSVYEIAKDLESYVRPSAKLPWNPVLAMKNTKTGEIEYKRIYKKQVDYNAQRLARTLAQHSYQQSFISTTENNPFITEYVWHSNGSRVCKLCKARDGATYKKTELPMDHPNGMCTMEPVVVKDMVDQLANWFNSPDGTYPEIDAFAGNFGYEAKEVKTTQDFVSKYGLANKSFGSWYDGMTKIQKAEAKALKEQSGLTWKDWYEQNVHSTGDANLDYVKKYGTSKKKWGSWYDGLTKTQKAEAKALKEQAGLTWNQWYEKYVYAGSTTAKAAQVASQSNNVLDIFGAKFEYDDLLAIGKKDPDKLYDMLSNIIAEMDIADFGVYDEQGKVVSAGLKKLVDKFGEPGSVKVAKATAKTATKAATKSLDDVLIAAQKKLDAIPNKTYSGIWLDDFTVADYEKYIDVIDGKIAKKKQYFYDQIGKLNDPTSSVYKMTMSNGTNASTIAKFQKYLDDLDELEVLGKQYVEAQKEVKAAKLAIQKAKGPVGKFDPTEYTDEAKAVARKFTSANAADRFHRPYLDEVWQQTSEYEHYSVWEYTQNSNPINKSLSGYHDGWSRYDFKGLGNTDLGHEDNWRYFDTSTFEKKFGVNGHKDYKNVVKNLTTAIDKSEMPESVYLVRGSDKGGLAGLLEGDFLSFDDAKRLLDSGDVKSIKAALEGQTFTNHSFMSTGIASGTGFPGEVKYEIFAPRGTHAIYAEPASYYGNTVGMNEKLYKVGQSYSSIGHEAEVIIQRGTDFRITEVTVEYGRVNVKMEVVNQPDYFKSGLEHTHNGGKTSYKK